MKKKIENRHLYYAEFIIISLIVSLWTFVHYIAYDQVLIHHISYDDTVDISGDFVIKDDYLYTIKQKPRMDLVVDDYYSGVTIKINSESNQMINATLYYSTQEKYNENTNVSGCADENGIVNLLLPEAINGRYYIHLDFESGGEPFYVEWIDVYQRNYYISVAVAIRALLICLLVMGMILFYEKKYRALYDDGLSAYIYILICSSMLFFVYAFFTRGGTLKCTLFTDASDTFGDYMHSVADALEGNPYDKYSNYPPLALFIFKLFSLMIPSSYEGTVIGMDKLMVLQPALWGLLLFLFITICGIVQYVNDKLCIEGMPKNMLDFFIVFSAPMVYAVDRGNIVILSLVFALLFVKYYSSSNKYVREFAYISLAVAFAIKIYPAIFGIILLREKKWIEAIRTALYGTVMVVIPLFYYDFMYAIRQFLTGMGMNSEYDYGMGTNVSLANIMRTGCAIFNISFSDTAYKIMLVLIVLMLLLTAFLVSNKHISLLAMCLMLLLIPRFNYYYAVTYAIIPFVNFLCELKESEDKKYNLVWETLYACIMIPWALPIINRLSAGYKTYVTWGSLLQYSSILIMVACCGYELYKELKLHFIQRD